VSLTLLVLCGLAIVLLVLLFWALRGPRKLAKREAGPHFLEGTSRSHADFLPQIRQAFAEADSLYLSQKAPRVLARRVRRERRRVGLAYLSAVRGDFQGLLRLSKIIATLSPEVAALQELERFRLEAKFWWRYEMIRMQLRAGLAPTPRLDRLSGLVSGLSVRMEAAMKEIGERAALATELASSLDGRGVDVT